MFQYYTDALLLNWWNKVAMHVGFLYPTLYVMDIEQAGQGMSECRWVLYGVICCMWLLYCIATYFPHMRAKTKFFFAVVLKASLTRVPLKISFESLLFPVSFSRMISFLNFSAYRLYCCCNLKTKSVETNQWQSCNLNRMLYYSLNTVLL